jgi:curved DNA-binding protein CbpA
MSKYEPLKYFLQNSNKATVVLTFQEIEGILGFPLCHSAFNHSAWWANDATHHVHARAWLEAGWMVESPTEAVRKHIVTFSKTTYEREKPCEYRQSFNTLQDICAYFSCPYPCDEKQLKTAYWKMIGKYHPDKVNGMGPEIIEQAEAKTKEINIMYEKYEEAVKFEELTQEIERINQERIKRERIEQERIEQERMMENYYQALSYIKNNTNRQVSYEAVYQHSELRELITAIIVTIIVVFILANIIRGCPAQKEPNRTPLPSVEYVLPKTDGSSITVKSDILTSHFGISYEQRQKSNLFMKDAYEYRYNGNGTWTITKKNAANYTNKNYIDTHNKDEVENYLRSLGF